MRGWSMVDGRWSMVDGRWSMVDGRSGRDQTELQTTNEEMFKMFRNSGKSEMHFFEILFE